MMEGARFEKVVAHRRDLRAALPSRFATRLRGQTVVRLGRRGKYLVAALSSGQTLLMHLGMSGSFRIDMPLRHSARDAIHDERTSARAHDHIVFHMSSGATITFNDPRRFGMMELVTSKLLEQHRVFRLLGPEPLAAEFDAAVLAHLAQGKKTTLKAALSDQRVIAGLGNIYVCEALHHAGLSPRRRASTIATPGGTPRASARRLVEAIKKVLTDALARGDDEGGGNPFRVYDREGEPCLRRGCAGTVRRVVQSGRSTFYCPVCQV